MDQFLVTNILRIVQKKKIHLSKSVTISHFNNISGVHGAMKRAHVDVPA
jgi:hypothetical protein